MTPEFITLHGAGDKRYIIPCHKIGWVYEDGGDKCTVMVDTHTDLRSIEVTESIAEIKDKLDGNAQ